MTTAQRRGNPEKYADTIVVDMVNQYLDEQ